MHSNSNLLLQLMRKFLVLSLALMLAVSLYGEKREIHIVATNDMHATIGVFPQLAALIDSLRTADPSLLVFSAGDNRTGNPLNDKYEIPGYPMVALMNQVGFNGSTLGNHEFDVHSLKRLIGLSNFRYICANVFSTDSAGIRTVPYQVFDVAGLKVGVIGVIQLGAQGIPGTHPDNLDGIWFTPALQAISEYSWLRKQCDVMILLSHLGYPDDIEMANIFPWLDLIIGGHTHTQLKGDEFVNGTLITQNKNRLPTCTHITLTVEKGKVIDKKAEYINVKKFPHQNKLVATIVDLFNDDPFFKRVVAFAEAPFKIKDQMTYMLCDALLTEGEGEVCIMNNGGTRIDSLSAGDITVHDILAMDPFYNDAVAATVTGEDILNIITTYSRGSLYHLPRVGGILCEAVIDKDDPDKNRLKSIQLKTLDGKEFDLNKTYKLVTSSYMASVCKQYFNSTTHSLNMLTSDLLTQFLEKKGVVNYEGVNRLKVTED